MAGAAAGVYATSKARRAAEALTVVGFLDRLTGWFAGARVLRDEVRAGAQDKETELRGRLTLVPDGETRQPALPADNVRRLDGRRHTETEHTIGKGDS